MRVAGTMLKRARRPPVASSVPPESCPRRTRKAKDNARKQGSAGSHLRLTAATHVQSG